MSERKDGDYKTGELLVFTAGDYSSYGIIGLGRALRNFTERDIREAFGHRHSYERLTELVKAGWVEEVTWKEVFE